MALVAYLAGAGLSGGGAPGLLGFGALVTALAFAFHAGGILEGKEGGTFFAAAVALASVVGGAEAPGYVHYAGDLALVLGLMRATASSVALSAPPSLAAGLSKPIPFLGAGPLVLAAIGVSFSHGPSARAGAMVTSSLFAALAVLYEMVRRRLELGVRARLLAAFSSLVLGLVLAVAMSRLLRSGFSDVALRGAIAPAALAATLLAFRANELRVARAARLLAVLAVVGGGLVLLSLDIAFRAPLEAATVVTVAGAICFGVGIFAPKLAEGLRPERGAWIEAVQRAEDALLRDAPDDAIRDAMVQLRLPAGPHAASPELWAFDPVRVLRVDAAGYAHEGAGTFPADVVTSAEREPESTLRTEVLRELQVRRPDLRPALRWMVDHGAMSATVVMEGGEARGLLVVPEGNRTDVMTLEEAVVFKRLADRFAGILGFRSAVARGLERERNLGGRIEALEDRLGQLEHLSAREAARHERATLRLARPATVGLYAARSRLSYEALEARTRVGAPMVVLHPSGVDPVPYVARAHLSGARAKGAFVLVEGTSAREHELARWTDSVASPLALADNGLLLLVDGAALPVDVQRLIAQSLAEKRAPWERAEPLDIVLALTSVAEAWKWSDSDGSRGSGTLDAALLARLGDAPRHAIVLPGLAERAEDLRSLLTDRLAREGLRVRGEPLALSDAALGRLIEHDFLGDEVELAAIVQRLVAISPSALIRAEDVDRLELHEAQRDAESSPKIRLV